jgi:signal transduction histidine kinase
MVSDIPTPQRPLNDLPVEPAPKGATPPASVAPGRLNLLAELGGRLTDAPEAPATLQAVVEATRAGTSSAVAELRVRVGRETLAFHAGTERPRPDRKISVRVLAGGANVGEISAWRSKPFGDADRLFLETVATHLGSALDAARLRRAERQAAGDPAPAQEETRSPLGRLRSLFGGAVDRAAPRTPAAGPDEDRLTSLTDDLVTLARVETTEAGTPEPIAVASWLRRSVARRLERAEAGGRALLLADPPEGLTVLANRDHLAAAFDHLLANALAYSPPGSAVTVSAVLAGSEVQLRVDDEGPGVGHFERERIFERYFRGQAAVATDVPGNGLGLAIVAEVAAAHGGRTWCEPGPAGGSRFTLALPAV